MRATRDTGAREARPGAWFTREKGGGRRLATGSGGIQRTTIKRQDTSTAHLHFHCLNERRILEFRGSGKRHGKQPSERPNRGHPSQGDLKARFSVRNSFTKSQESYRRRAPFGNVDSTNSPQNLPTYLPHGQRILPCFGGGGWRDLFFGCQGGGGCEMHEKRRPWGGKRGVGPSVRSGSVAALELTGLAPSPRPPHVFVFSKQKKRRRKPPGQRTYLPTPMWCRHKTSRWDLVNLRRNPARPKPPSVRLIALNEGQLFSQVTSRPPLFRAAHCRYLKRVTQGRLCKSRPGFGQLRGRTRAGPQKATLDPGRGRP